MRVILIMQFFLGVAANPAANGCGCGCGGGAAYTHSFSGPGIPAVVVAPTPPALNGMLCLGCNMPAPPFPPPPPPPPMPPQMPAAAPAVPDVPPLPLEGGLKVGDPPELPPTPPIVLGTTPPPTTTPTPIDIQNAMALKDYYDGTTTTTTGAPTTTQQPNTTANPFFTTTEAPTTTGATTTAGPTTTGPGGSTAAPVAFLQPRSQVMAEVAAVAMQQSKAMLRRQAAPPQTHYRALQRPKAIAFLQAVQREVRCDCKKECAMQDEANKADRVKRNAQPGQYFDALYR